MFTKHDAIELSATYCRVMETLRASIEIFTGQRVKYEHISFRRGNAVVVVGSQSKAVRFSLVGTQVDWCFDQGHEKQNEWLSTTSVDGGLRVYFQRMWDNQVRIHGDLLDCYWFGQDHVCREIQFTYPGHADSLARKAGITVAELQAQVVTLITSRQSPSWK